VVPVQKRIVVPLDGSELADRIITQLRRLLVAQDVEVVLLTVVEAYLDEGSLERRKQDALDHLAGLRDALVEEGATATIAVLEGDPVERIAEHAERSSALLVVMSTHGRSGLTRFVRGSVAEGLLRRCMVPVLVANPRAVDVHTAGGELRFKRLLVPLDGSDVALEVLPLVEEVATRFEAEVLLLEVAWQIPSSTEGPFLMPPILRTPAEIAAGLEPVRKRLAARGIDARVLTGYTPVALEIIDVAEREAVDLVVMSTHGRSGVSRWLFGSVAEQVLRHCTRPLLVRRVHGVPDDGSQATTRAVTTEDLASSRSRTKA